MGNVTAAAAVQPRLEAMRIVTAFTSVEQFIGMFHRFCDASSCFIPSSDTRPVGSALAFSIRLADGTPMLRGTCVVKQVWGTPENPFRRPGVVLEITRLAAESAGVFFKLLARKAESAPIAGLAPLPGPGAEPSITAAARVEQAAVFARAAAAARRATHVALGEAAGLLDGDRVEATEAARDRRGEPALVPPIEATAGAIPAEPPTERHLVPPPDETPTVQMPALPSPTEARVEGSPIVLPANPLAAFDDASLDALLDCTVTEDTDRHVLGIPQAPVLPEDDATLRTLAAPVRAQVATLLGMAPLAIDRGGALPSIPAEPPPGAREPGDAPRPAASAHSGAPSAPSSGAHPGDAGAATASLGAHFGDAAAASASPGAQPGDAAAATASPGAQPGDPPAATPSSGAHPGDAPATAASSRELPSPRSSRELDPGARRQPLDERHSPRRRAANRKAPGPLRHDERFWMGCAIAAVVFAAAIVLVSTLASVG